MPELVSCPKCGGDGTEKANVILAEAAAASSIAPSLHLSAVKERASRRPLVQKRGLSDEDLRDLLEAKADVRRAAGNAFLVATVTLALTVPSFFGFEILGLDQWALVDVIAVAGLSYGLFRLSRLCAILMCLYYLACTILLWGRFGVVGITVRAIVLYYFARGVQAAFSYHKLKKLSS